MAVRRGTLFLTFLAVVAVVTAINDDRGILYMMGATEDSHILQFYGYELPSGKQFHSHQYRYDPKARWHAAEDHDDIIADFNPQRHIFLVSDTQGVMELRANKNQLVSRNEVFHLHSERDRKNEDSSIVAIDYDGIHRKAIVVSDTHDSMETLEIHVLNPSSGNTKFMCSKYFGHVDLARHGIHTWDPVNEVLYYVLGDPADEDLRLVTYDVDKCEVVRQPRLQQENIRADPRIPTAMAVDHERMKEILSLDYSELTGTLIASMYTTDGHKILASINPTTGAIALLYDYGELTTGFHEVQGTTYLDFKEDVHFSAWLEDTVVSFKPHEKMQKTHVEYDIKIRMIGVNIRTGGLAFHFDCDVNHSFIPRALGHAPDGKLPENKSEL